jgi:hypothetical protein
VRPEIEFLRMMILVYQPRQEGSRPVSIEGVALVRYLQQKGAFRSQRLIPDPESLQRRWQVFKDVTCNQKVQASRRYGQLDGVGDEIGL